MEMSDEELLNAYRSVDSNTLYGAAHYREEILRRSQDENTAALHRWNSESDLEAMQQKPEFRASLGTLKGEIVSAEPHSFELMYTVGEP